MKNDFGMRENLSFPQILPVKISLKQHRLPGFSAILFWPVQPFPHATSTKDETPLLFFQITAPCPNTISSDSYGNRIPPLHRRIIFRISVFRCDHNFACRSIHFYPIACFNERENVHIFREIRNRRNLQSRRCYTASGVHSRKQPSRRRKTRHGRGVKMAGPAGGSLAIGNDQNLSLDALSHLRVALFNNAACGLADACPALDTVRADDGLAFGLSGKRRSAFQSNLLHNHTSHLPLIAASTQLFVSP